MSAHSVLMCALCGTCKWHLPLAEGTWSTGPWHAPVTACGTHQHGMHQVLHKAAAVSEPRTAQPCSLLLTAYTLYKPVPFSITSCSATMQLNPPMCSRSCSTRESWPLVSCTCTARGKAAHQHTHEPQEDLRSSSSGVGHTSLACWRWYYQSSA